MVLITNHLAICFHDPPSPPKKRGDGGGVINGGFQGKVIG